MTCATSSPGLHTKSHWFVLLLVADLSHHNEPLPLYCFVRSWSSLVYTTLYDTQNVYLPITIFDNTLDVKSIYRFKEASHREKFMAGM